MYAILIYHVAQRVINGALTLASRRVALGLADSMKVDSRLAWKRKRILTNQFGVRASKEVIPGDRGKCIVMEID